MFPQPVMIFPLVSKYILDLITKANMIDAN